MRFWPTLGRAVRLRCPRCGTGNLFTGLFKMAPACGECGLNFHPESGFYVGAMYINYAVTVALGLPIALFLLRWVGAFTLVAPMVAFGVLFPLLFPLLFFRTSRSLWLGIATYVEAATTDRRPRA